SINVVVLNRWFLGVFLGTALGCVVLSVGWILCGPTTSTTLAIAGAALYLLGSIGITSWFHVSLHDALAAVSPDAPDAAARWGTFVTEWTRWNTVRCVASLAAAALLGLALIDRARFLTGSGCGAPSQPP